MIRNKCTVALLLVCSMATLADAQDVRPTQDPPLVTFNDLKNGDLVEGPFRIEGFVLQTYKCPPCPEAAQCKPCLGDHIVVTDNLEEKGPALVKRLRIFTSKPEQFELKRTYSFLVKVRGKIKPGRTIDEVDLISSKGLDVAEQKSEEIFAVNWQQHPKTKPSVILRIAIVGDSTVADYALDDPQRGWGQLFPELVDQKRVTIKNSAVNGRSTKTFKLEGRWEPVLDFKPDYIFIQFGHNDSHAKGRPESTDPQTDYATHLEDYVTSARAHGATPILVTPMHRGTWDKDGRHLTQELLPYADAMRRVAKEKRAPLIDLYILSENAFEKLGAEELNNLFAVPATDHTHFNERGARLLASLVAKDAVILVPALKKYLKK